MISGQLITDEDIGHFLDVDDIIYVSRGGGTKPPNSDLSTCLMVAFCLAMLFIGANPALVG